MSDALSFLKDLDAEQLQNAHEIGTRAQAMGIPPALAISIAYQESRLRADAPIGKKGERGMMQVKPATGKDYGYSIADLNDRSKNIDAGLAVLKSALNVSKNDPRMAALAYNAGEGSPAFYGGDIPESTEQYLKDLQGYGAFKQGMPPPSEESKDTTQEDSQPKYKVVDKPKRPPSEQAEIEDADLKRERAIAGLVGAGVGTSKSVAEMLGETFRGLSKPSAAPSTPSTPSTTTAPLSSPLPEPSMRVEPAMVPEPSAQAVRIMQGGQGDTLGTTGRARQEGYNIETAQKAATKAQMEALTPQARQVLADMPGMTSTQSGVLFPRTEARPTAGPRPATPPPAPNLDIGALRPGAAPPVPTNAPLGSVGSVVPAEPTLGPLSELQIPRSTAVPAPSALDEVTAFFRRATPAVTKGLRTVAAPLMYVANKVAAPAAMADAASEAMNLYQQSQMPPEKRQDTTSNLLSGTQALGGLATLGFPIIGGTITGAAALAQYMRNHPEERERMMRQITNPLFGP